MPVRGSRKLRYTALALVCCGSLTLGLVLVYLGQPTRSPIDTAQAWIKAVNVGDSSQIAALTYDNDSYGRAVLGARVPYVYSRPRCWHLMHGGHCQPAGLIGLFPYRSVRCAYTYRRATIATVDCVVAFRDQQQIGNQDEVVWLERIHGRPWTVDWYYAS